MPYMIAKKFFKIWLALRLNLHMLTLYNPPPPIFCSHAFNFGAALLWCALVTFPKNSFTPCGEKIFLIGGHDLSVRGVSKYKVDMIFIIFREFNTMLEIVDS